MTELPTPPHSMDRMALIEGVLTGAFFSPLHVTDLFGFLWGQEGLLGLEKAEVFDLFVRGAIAAETIEPESTEGRDPLAWLLSMEHHAPVGAHTLANLRHDRPFLFHRLLYSLPAVREGRLDPKSFELMEDFLKEAMSDQLELRLAAETEIEGVRAGGLILAGVNEEDLPSEVGEIADRLLTEVDPSRAQTDIDLVLWMSREGGIDDIDRELAPLVMIETWSRWVSTIVGNRSDTGLLTHLMPDLAMSASELALHAPPAETEGHIISSACPYCGSKVSLKLGKEVKALADCPHLIFVGTGDEVHLMQALQHCDLGRDFLELLSSYYQSPSDLDLFSQIVNDLFEMVRSQDRLRVAPITCETAAKGFYYLKAYFANQDDPETTRH